MLNVNSRYVDIIFSDIEDAIYDTLLEKQAIDVDYDIDIEEETDRLLNCRNSLKNDIESLIDAVLQGDYRR